MAAGALVLGVGSALLAHVNPHVVPLLHAHLPSALRTSIDQLRPNLSVFVLFIAEVSYTAAAFKNPMYNEEMRVADFLDEPHIAVIKALLLEFQPTFLDILPLYIVMLLIFPAILIGIQRHRLPALVGRWKVQIACE